MAGIKDLARFAERLPLEVKLAVAESVHEAYRLAVAHSAAELAQRGAGPGAALGDAFQDAWTTSGPTEAGDDVVGRVENAHPLAGRLKQGRGRKFTRPVDERVAAETEPAFRRRLREAFENARNG